MIKQAKGVVGTKVAKMIGAEEIKYSARFLGGMAGGLRSLILRLFGKRDGEIREETLQQAMERMDLTYEQVDEAIDAFRKERFVLAAIATAIFCYLLYGAFFLWTSFYAPVLTTAVLFLACAKMMVASFRVWQISIAKQCPTNYLPSMKGWIDGGEWWVS